MLDHTVVWNWIVNCGCNSSFYVILQDLNIALVLPKIYGWMPQVQICCWHAGHVCSNVAAVGTWCTNGGLVHWVLRAETLGWPTVGRLCCWFFESGFMVPNRSTVKTVAIYCLVIKHGNAPSNASVECHCHLLLLHKPTVHCCRLIDGSLDDRLNHVKGAQACYFHWQELTSVFFPLLHFLWDLVSICPLTGGGMTSFLST